MRKFLWITRTQGFKDSPILTVYTGVIGVALYHSLDIKATN